MPHVPIHKSPEPFHVTVTRYVGPDGRRCKRDAPGAVKQTTQTRTYYADLPSLEEGARPDRVPLETSDLGAAWVRLRDLLRERTRQREGLADPLLGQARKPIAEHVREWLAEVISRGTSRAQVDLLGARVGKLIELAGWKLLSDVRATSCLNALQQLTAERHRGVPNGYDGRGAQTRNHYLSAARQFMNWCADEDRVGKNPLRKIKTSKVARDRRHARRSPSDEDVALLMAHLEGKRARVRNRMTGPQRGLGYRLAMATGFRAKELRSLRPESFDLAGGTVTARAGYAKNGETARQALPAWLVEELRTWFASGGGLWEDFPQQHPGRLLQADLKAAGVAYATKGPEGLLFFDMHSFRHWYCTWAAHVPGISPKALLTMVRHSDPRLTLQTYAKAMEEEVKKAVGQMPRPGGGSKDGGPGCTEGCTEGREERDRPGAIGTPVQQG